MVISGMEEIVPDVLEEAMEPVQASAEERERVAQRLALAQERWTKLIRRRRMEEYGDPDSPLPVWPVKPPDVPLEELKRIHALIEEEFDDPNVIQPDAP